MSSHVASLIPVPGQRFTDPKGLRWSVQAVQPMRGREAPWFTVRLRFGPEPAITLTCHEFWKLQQQRGLKPAR